MPEKCESNDVLQVCIARVTVLVMLVHFSLNTVLTKISWLNPQLYSKKNPDVPYLEKRQKISNKHEG